MKHSTNTLAFVALCLIPGPASAAPQLSDCNLGARYDVLAQRAAENLDQRKQFELLEKSVTACENYSTYMNLGTAAASFANNKKTQRASEAYSRAYELAADSGEEAMAIFGYAKLLHHTNNDQQALRYAYAARNLDPKNVSITALAERIAENLTVITEEQIVRGFGRLALKPLQLKEDIGGPDGRTGGKTGGAGTRETLPSVNIPLNFEFGTTRLTAESAQNVQVLADTLAKHYANRNILFVGHADVRGTTDYNMSLSIGRAQAVQTQVMERSPFLREKISIVGKGESTPLSGGDTETDHSVNRRLEIVIQ